MRRLVVGCGYVGTRVAEAWRSSGDEVFAVTRSAERAETFAERGWRPIVADVTRPESLADLPEVECVLHAVGYDRSAGPSQREVYVDGLGHLLAALPSSVRRFVHVSSTSVYGQSDGSVVDETSPCEPQRDSGVVCRDAEQLVWQRFPATDSTAAPAATVIRLAGIYGPDRLLRRAEALRSGEPIGGEPEAWLNLIHVEDAAAVVRVAADADTARGRTYLVCDDQPVTRRDYFSQLAELVGTSPPTFDASTGARHGAGGLNKRCSNRRVRDELGFEPRFPTIAEGLPDAIERSAG